MLTLMNQQLFRICARANFGPLEDSYDYQPQGGEPHPEKEHFADQGMPSSSFAEYGSRSTPARENSRRIQNYLHQEEEPKPETKMLEHQFLSFSLVDRDGPGSEHVSDFSASFWQSEVGFGRSRDACSSSFTTSPAPAYNSNPIIASSSSPIRTSASNSNPSTNSSSFSSGIGEQKVDEAEKHEALAMRMSACRCSIGSGVYLAIAELAFDISGHYFWEFSSANFSMSTVRSCLIFQNRSCAPSNDGNSNGTNLGY